MREALTVTGAIVGMAAVLYLTLLVRRHGLRNAWGLIRYDRRRRGSLRAGDAAPDATLTTLDGGEAVSLRSRFGQRPLVLVFGSYT